MYLKYLNRIYFGNAIKRGQYFLILNEKQCNIYKFKHISTMNNPVSRLGHKIRTIKNYITCFMLIIACIPN